MLLTPDETRLKLVAIFPMFEKQWADKENLWREEDGAFTLHGLFNDFSCFVRDNFYNASEATRRELFDFIEACISNDESDRLDNAVCTCFLENLANEPPLSYEMRRYMGPKSKAFFDFWN